MDAGAHVRQAKSGHAHAAHYAPGPAHYARAAPDSTAELVQVQSTRRSMGRTKIGSSVRPPLLDTGVGTPGPGAYDYDNHALIRKKGAHAESLKSTYRNAPRCGMGAK